MANQYVTEWTDYKNWDWKVIIKPAGGITSTWADVDFPSYSIEDFNRTYEFDERRYGLPDVNEIKISFNIRYIEDTNLLNALFYPHTVVTHIPYDSADYTDYNSVPFLWDGSTTDIYGGTIFEVYTNYGSGSLEKYFVGIQNIGIEAGIDDGIIEITAQDIFKTAMQSVPIKELGWAYQRTADIENDRFINEACYYHTGDRFLGLVNTSFDNYFNFIKVDDFFNHLIRVLNTHLQFLMRDDTLTPSNTIYYNFNSKYYKQSYDSSYSKGAELAVADRYMIVSKSNKEIANINDSDYEVIETIADHYSDNCESLWDWVNMLYEGESLVAFPNYTSFNMDIDEILSGTNSAIDLEYCYNIKPTFLNRAYQNTSVSNIESSGDDINTYSKTIGGTDNSSEISLTNILASRIFAGTSKWGNWNDVIEISSKHTFWRNKDNEHHFSTIFYKEKPSYSGNDYVGRICFNTVHGHVNHYYGKNVSAVDIYSDNYISFSTPATSTSLNSDIEEADNIDEIGSIVMNVMQTTCKSQTLADTILYVITNTNDFEINFDMDLGLDITTFDERVFDPVGRKYELDLDLIPHLPSGILSSIDGRFVITKLEHTIHSDNINDINKVNITMRNIK